MIKFTKTELEELEHCLNEYIQLTDKPSEPLAEIFKKVGEELSRIKNKK